MGKTKNSEKKILLRLPAMLAKEVERRAKKFSRSVNGQIVYELGPEYETGLVDVSRVK